jgi:hypothetical protein
MHLSMLALARGALLAGAVCNVLLATVLFRRVNLPLSRRWWTRFEQMGARFHRADAPAVPPFLRSELVIRVWTLLNAVLLLAAWWFLGTAAGARVFSTMPRF